MAISKAESAKMIPVTPPVMKVETNPIANIIAGVKTKEPFHKVVR